MEIDFTKWIVLQDIIHLLRKKDKEAKYFSNDFVTAVPLYYFRETLLDRQLNK